jgi:hypothetical protein
MSQDTIKLPNFFVGFLQKVPPIHPHHDEIHSASLKHIGISLNLSPKRLKHHEVGGLAYFASVMMPDVNDFAVRVAMDWLHWVRICFFPLTHKTTIALKLVLYVRNY